MDSTQTRIRPLLAVAVLLAATSSSANAATPTIRSLGVEGGTVAGSERIFLIRASDPAAAVSGVVLSVEGSSFGSSACRAAAPGSPPPAAPFAPASPVVLAVPHLFGDAGIGEGAARVDAGGCAKPTGSVLQPFTATITEPGQPLQPLVLGTPIPLPEGPIDPPELPGLPELPPLSPLDELPTVLPATRACEGTHAPIRRSAASRRRARLAIRCLVNRERRRRGLRRLGGNGRLLGPPTRTRAP